MVRISFLPMLVCLLLFSGVSKATSFSFRVQCTKNGSPNLLKVFNAIPERQSYILPSGHTMYFSGGYYSAYSEAKKRLDEVHAAGIDEAFIRVFKNRMYLSDRVSANLLKTLLMDYDQMVFKADSVKVKELPEVKKKAKKKAYTREEFEALKKQKGAAKFIESSDPRKKSEKKKMKKKEKGIIGNAKKDKERLQLLEKPTYKIEIERVNGDASPAFDISSLDEIVYQNKVGNKMAYTLGHFTTVKAAEEALLVYKKDEKCKNFKVVGYYHGSLISKGLAVQIQEEYEAMEKNKKK